ncbi:ribonuclease Z [Salinimicrobium sediminilitoris]|uniref:ribonuclease Z n=1 Tax=Salinimicrobium sediminilitoris TaxID=2876715 RepID=UPI001E2C534B|nr:ribonuclease Z [Salinimicrobium sediminilitoris]MCC8359071.1 ribonuclease Z [Salinimicrobium sediminilitoris]
MKLTVLGCYAATPRTFTNPTSQVLEINNELFLIDCGEGTQVELRRHKIKFGKIKHVFISHLHGDHFYGLVGLISTFMLLNRKTELHIYGPKGIKEIVLLQLKHSNSWTGYPLYFHELTSTEPQVILNTRKVTVETIPLKHRIYANGYLFREKPKPRKLLVEEAEKYDIDVAYYNGIKKGKDAILDDGRIIPNAQLTADPEPPESFAFCSDTAYNPILAKQLKDITVLYHESTFLEEHAYLAAPTGHSTAREAAAIARAANVSHLVLGHYSTRYDSIEGFKKEASKVFPEVHLADDGKVLSFSN